jgi:hypothetical protein
MSEPLLMTMRVSTQGVVCEVKFIGPADTSRSEMKMALMRAEREVQKAIDARYGIAPS